MMDLPGDKKQAVLQSSDDKKWQMVRDNTRRRYEHPPSEYLSKLSYVMDADGPRKARKRANDPAILQSLQSLEISLRTNNIVWVQDFLSEDNGGLKELVKYMSYRCQAEMQLPPPSRGSSSSRLTIRKTKSLDVNSYLESPRHSLRQSSPSSAPYEESSMDIHVCVLCLKALMNNAHGFAAVMKDPDAITRMALSMFYGTHRTVITVIELLAAVCLVKGGHIKILQAVDNFKQANSEQHRFERLVEYFMEDNATPDFQVACMNFINVIVHSAEDMNFRVHLQHEFTLLGLDDFIVALKYNPHVAQSLLNQIAAYEQNYILVETLLEESKARAQALETIDKMKEDMQEVQDKHQAEEFQSMKRIAELEKQLAELKRMQAAAAGLSPPPTSSSPDLYVDIQAPPPPPAPPLPGAAPPPPPPPPPGHRSHITHTLQN
jgi:hypothetical protein